MRVQSTDLSFITNEGGISLKDRLLALIKDCETFDCIVGYFYLSGFHLIYKALENTKKIRILTGMGIDPKSAHIIHSYKEIKEKAQDKIKEELGDSEDSYQVEEAIRKFIEWIESGKLEIKAYPRLHAKVYIMTFKEGDRDLGRVITGSSNLTQSGLEGNLEFNVELKNRADYEYAKEKFEELWSQAVDITEDYVKTITEKTWLNDKITPYELYLKFLYEYFRDELNAGDFELKLPSGIKRLKYQEQAVINAKRILEAYGGVFISDVVGLGKTYITAMLLKQLDDRTIVIAPPNLIDEKNPGSWVNVLDGFKINAKFFSIGKLDDAISYIQSRDPEDSIKNVVIDESHRFRTEDTKSYEKLAQICRGKRVILVSATPYNNHPMDILSQLKLFQNSRKSLIPGVPNLESFFKKLDKKLKEAKKEGEEEYVRVSREISKEIREKVLKYVMIRRTRRDILNYFREDIDKEGIKFPEVEPPKPIYYQLEKEEDDIFMETLKILTKDIKYSRYKVLTYHKNEDIRNKLLTSQKNLATIMKILLVKRLESSFYAFKNSINRFVKYYENFIEEYKKGHVYVSKEHINKLFELLEEEDYEAIEKLIEEDKVQRYPREEFFEELEKDLYEDLSSLRRIKQMWDNIKRDPKLEKLIKELEENHILKNNKVIIFTESKETAEYLYQELTKKFENTVLLFHGSASENHKELLIKNFDANLPQKQQDNTYRILVTTDTLAEGINLHRSNIIINYDIPWNPTKIIQRVGRVNRIGTKFDTIYVFNFFPTEKADSEIELTKIARSKVEAFLNMLGEDSAILTQDEPVASHELFDKLISKEILEEDKEEESEIKYLRIIEEIRDKDPKLFEKIKHLPKKARSSKRFSESLKDIASPNSLLTFFRKGKLMKFFLSDKEKTVELDFLTAAKILESQQNEKRAKFPPLEGFYELFSKNKEAFMSATEDEIVGTYMQAGRSSYDDLLKILKAVLRNGKELTEEQQEYYKTLINRLEEGAIPKKTVRKTLKELNALKEDIQDPIKVLSVCQSTISSDFLKSHHAQATASEESKGEVILSLYLEGDE
ncbi:helicase-related protein [Hydrogenobacter thermophilus]|uniref:helicase-related protein n=1 Tax=Hydrogenobacter thermophilus TaxID=940 RepID=UPI0030F4D3D4